MNTHTKKPFAALFSLVAVSASVTVGILPASPVNAAPLITAYCSATPTSQTVGNNVLWSVTASGGTGSYSYAWSGLGMNGATGPNVTVAYANPGTYTGSVTVTSGTQSIIISCGQVTITAPTPAAGRPINLTFPNGGESFPRNSIQTVQWNYDPTKFYPEIEAQVMVQFYSESGALVGNIPGPFPISHRKADGPFNLVPGKYKVRISANGIGGLAQDYSDNYFKIVQEGAAVADFLAPAIPQGITVRAISPTLVVLNWTASTDDLNRVGYRIYRNGTYIAATTLTTYIDGAAYSLAAGKYTYTVSAYDSSPARNASPQSAPARIELPGQSSLLSYQAEPSTTQMANIVEILSGILDSFRRTLGVQ